MWFIAVNHTKNDIPYSCIVTAPVKESRWGKKRRVSVHGLYRIGKIIGDGNFAIVRECKHR